MSYETKTDNLGKRHIGGGWNDGAHNSGVEGVKTTEDTIRTDVNSAAANEEQAFTDVDAEITDPIGTITHTPAQGGATYTWTITSGNDDGDFAVSNAGVLTRVTGHTLDGGPYSLVIRYTEGSPLHRYRDVEVSVTVAA